METPLADKNPQWDSYQGQSLSLADTNHVFKIKISDFQHRITDYPSTLSQQEIDRASRFLKQEDKENYLLRKYALRIILGNFSGRPPAEIRYHKTENKKPAIANIQFNTSHTKGYAVIAVSQETVGIDIEYLNRDFDYSDLLPSCFSAEESRLISLSEDMQQRFYILWTRKEALIKATGEGLAENLSDIPSLKQQVERRGERFEIRSYTDHDLLLSTAFISNLKKLKLWEYSY